MSSSCMRHFAGQIHYVQWQWWLCVNLRLLNVWNGCCVGRAQTGRTFVLFVRVTAFEYMRYWYMFDTVWSRNFAHMRHFAVQTHYNGNDDCLCVDLRLFDVWNGYWVGSKSTARKFSLLRLSSNLAVLLVFDAAWVRKLSSPSSCVAQIYCNGTCDSALIFVLRTRVVYLLALNKQAVRLYCCLRTSLNLNASVVFNAVWGRNFTLITWCPNTLQWRWRLCVDLCWLNVWNVRRVVGWP